ncbi:MAG: uracil-DNA glycosylase [Gammaproteobacteria bacterium]
MDKLNPLRAHYLEAMGIQLWEQRAAQAPPDGVRAANSGLEQLATPQAAISRDSLMEQPMARKRQVTSPLAADAAGIPIADIMTLDWPALEQAVNTCTRCRLSATRSNMVFGVGNRRADWMVIGEAPGAEEDRQGEPFVGRAGQLLNAMLKAIGLAREDVYIANILKSRPPQNRDPLPDEMAACAPFLMRQIQLIQPKIILAVGRIAAQNLLQTDTKIGLLRGKRYVYPGTDIPLVVTYHPAYLLRSPGEKRKAWEDLKFAVKVRKGEA